MKVYLLLWSHPCCFDGDDYVGIYTNPSDLKLAYDTMLLTEFRDMTLHPTIRVFDEVNSKQQKYRSVDGVEKIKAFLCDV